jgi:hypothetical protein
LSRRRLKPSRGALRIDWLGGGETTKEAACIRSNPFQGRESSLPRLRLHASLPR